jgi:uncharacterized phage protein gp47/JayE
MAFGLTPQGFFIKRLADIKSETEAKIRSVLGNSVNLTDSSVLGNVNGIYSESLSLIWEALEDLYNSRYPDTAEGVSLVNAVAFNGLTIQGAAKSVQKNQLLFGTSGSLIPQDTQFSVDGNPTAKFLTNSDVTLGDGVNAIQKITFSAVPDAGSFTLTFDEQTTAAIPFGAIAADVQSALNALPNLSGVSVTGDFSTGFFVEFAGDDGLQPQDLLTEISLLTSSAVAVTISITQTQAGVAQGVVDCTATVTGPIDAPIGTLIVIDTPRSGLVRTINKEATTVGRNKETDIQLRQRRANTLSIGGKATLDALRANLLNVQDVNNVEPFENIELTTDGDGRPGKSFEMVVDGGTDGDIGSAIWSAKPAGIKPYGAISVSVLDSQGQSRTVAFSRPTQVRIFTSLDLTIDATLFPDNGAALVQEAILSWGNALGIGQKIVVYPQLVAQLNSIPGILDVTVRIDRSPVSTTPGAPAHDDNIAIAAFEVASFAAPDTGVNVL